MTTTHMQSFHSIIPNEDKNLFDNEHIERLDADTMTTRYGTKWKYFASNVREITRADGSIIKEYIIEDPNLLENVNKSSQIKDSILSINVSNNHQQRQTLKHQFDEIKEKFKQKKFSYVSSSPLTLSSNSNDMSVIRENFPKQINDLQRRKSDESVSIHKNSINSLQQSHKTQHNYHHSQSMINENSNRNSPNSFDPIDEADEEVRQIHQQGEKLHSHHQKLVPSRSQNQSDVQYEIVDQNGNLMVINDVQNLIKMSGVRKREIAQSDGTILKEYVIDDPQLLSQLHSQNQQPIISSYNQQCNSAPQPPPRIPLRPSVLFRHGRSTINECDIQQIRVLEPQRRYEYLTRTGRRIQFLITNSNHFNGQLINDFDIRELTNVINKRLLSSSSKIGQPFHFVKQWYPSVNLTHHGSDIQSYSNNSNTNSRRIQTNLDRSASSDILNHESDFLQQQTFNEPITNEQTYQYHHEIRNQYNQINKNFQISTKFLPSQQVSKSTNSSPINNHHLNCQHQTTVYPYSRTNTKMSSNS